MRKGRFIAAVVCFMLSGLYPQLSGAAPEPLTDCEAEPTDMTIAIGDVVQCAITPAGDSDVFRFQGTTGTVILLSLLDLTGGCGGFSNYPCPVVQLYEPGNNSTPLRTLGPGTASVQLDLTKTGTYTIQVNENGNNQTEEYRIALERLFPASPTALPLCFGCVVTDTINPAPDRDFFLFGGAQGATITLTLTDLTGGCGGFSNYPCPVAQLFDPNRTLVDTLGPGTESITVPLPLTGTYTIHVSEFGLNQTESYNLGLTCLFGCPPDKTLTVAKAGTGTGTVTSNPVGIDCGTDCTEAYTHGTNVHLTPRAAAGSTFAGWSGHADCSDGIVTMDANKTCTATFTTIETLTLHDNFNSALIDPTKWTGSAFDTLETIKRIVFPVAGDGELQMVARAYGLRTSSTAGEGRNGNNRLRFRRPDPNVIRAMQATIRVNSASAVGCPTAGSEVTQSQIRLLGYFFNAGRGEVGEAADDVRGTIEIRRLSNNPVANQLNVRAVVIRCTDTDCVHAETLFNQPLGTILVGQAATVLMQWNPPTNGILFRLNANPVVAFTYALSDTVPPMNFFDKKHIEINHFIGNCVAAQTSAFMSATVDDVFLNNAATLAPLLTAPEELAVDTSNSAPAEGEPFVPEPEDEDEGKVQKPVP